MDNQATPVTPSGGDGGSETERVVRLLSEFFFVRTDWVAIRAGNGKPIPVQPAAPLADLLRTHVLGDDAPAVAVRFHPKKGGQTAFKGRFRVGSYSTSPDGSVRWLCLDFDGPGHSNGLLDPAAAALATRQRFVAAGITSYLECSGSAKGWHLWVFFSEAVTAADVRALAFDLIPGSLPLANGKVADPRRGHGIEVFPKQDRIEPGGLGNMVWLPWWSDAAPGGNLFFAVEEDGSLRPDSPTSFETVPASSVPAAPERTSRRELADDSKRKAPKQPDRSAASAEWSAWRQKALAALRLETVYSLWLLTVS